MIQRRFKRKWPKYEVEMPQEAFGQMLLYWDEMLEPEKNQLWEHPKDVLRDAELRKAIKLLLDFCGVKP